MPSQAAVDYENLRVLVARAISVLESYNAPGFISSYRREYQVISQKESLIGNDGWGLSYEDLS